MLMATIPVYTAPKANAEKKGPEKDADGDENTSIQDIFKDF